MFDGLVVIYKKKTSIPRNIIVITVHMSAPHPLNLKENALDVGQNNL